MNVGSLAASSLRIQKRAQTPCVRLHSRAVVRAASTETFYDYSVKVGNLIERNRRCEVPTVYRPTAVLLSHALLQYVFGQERMILGHRWQKHQDEQIQGKSGAGSKRRQPMRFHQAIQGIYCSV